MNLNGVEIGSRDPKKLAEFYTKAFGEPKWTMPGDWYGWDIGSGHLFFGPQSEVQDIASEPLRIVISFDDPDVRTTYESLIAAGAKKVNAPYNPDPSSKDFWQATVADPEGNYLRIANPM